ncbi:MAG: 4-hydroxy-tetrahydrodipicolinate synthase [Puniceicoccales bacterium]|jgi:4-hydroxy-tetrahydrodipicolinate synthase|nr:4-hydroxy-tetrahydrodipicolinate synthase [Puniceicoccales bacterium]
MADSSILVSNGRRFGGVHTALVTPFKNDEVACEDLQKLVEFQIANGVNGLVSVGTTGESPTLSTEEHCEVIVRTVEYARGRVPVIAGTGSNATSEAISLTQHADKAGADAFLIVAPYYNKPSQEGLFQHFSAVAACTAKPILLYSILGRCGVELDVATVVRLREKCPNIVGIKEASASCERVSRFVNALDEDFVVLSGDDASTLPFIALGASGLISVASNWLPAEVVALVRHALAGERLEALRMGVLLADVFKQLFIETNPVPVKYVLARAGLIQSAEVRLPLTGPSASNRAVLDALLKTFPKH